MKMLIYGASDDLLEIESDTFRTEFDVSGKWSGYIIDPEGQSLRLTAEFDARGPMKADWTLGIQNTANWPRNWALGYDERPDRDSDPAIILEVPEGTKVVKA